MLASDRLPDKRRQRNRLERPSEQEWLTAGIVQSLCTISRDSSFTHRWITQKYSSSALLGPNLIHLKAPWRVIFDSRPAPNLDLSTKKYSLNCKPTTLQKWGGCQEGHWIPSSDWHSIPCLMDIKWDRYQNKGPSVNCFWVSPCQMKLSPCHFLTNVWPNGPLGHAYL